MIYSLICMHALGLCAYQPQSIIRRRVIVDLSSILRNLKPTRHFDLHKMYDRFFVSNIPLCKRILLTSPKT